MKLAFTFNHRSIWLGFAMLWVMFYHSRFIFEPNLFSPLLEYGYAGVDIFVFASGIGCYYSLDRDPDVLNFMKRRLKRLAPVYFCFIIPWLLWKNSQAPLPIDAIFGNLLGIVSFASWNYHFNWYISALLLFYLLLPYLKRLTDSVRSLWADLLVIGFLYGICLSFWNVGYQNMIILSRIPILYLGVLYGKLGKKGAELTKPILLLHTLAAAAGCFLVYYLQGASGTTLWNHGFYWHPFLLIVPCFCLAASGIGEILHRFRILKPLYRLLEILGTYSFELYLVHIFLFEQFVPLMVGRFPSVSPKTVWLCGWLAIAPLATLLNRAAALITHFIQKQTHI